MCTVIDMLTRLPIEVWFEERAQAQASDTTFIDRLLELLSPKTLLILDRGFYDFTFFENLVEQGCAWITRPKSNAGIHALKSLTTTPTLRDSLILLGSGKNGTPQLTVRLIEYRRGNT